MRATRSSSFELDVCSRPLFNASVAGKWSGAGDRQRRAVGSGAHVSGACWHGRYSAPCSGVLSRSTQGISVVSSLGVPSLIVVLGTEVTPLNARPTCMSCRILCMENRNAVFVPRLSARFARSCGSRTAQTRPAPRRTSAGWYGGAALHSRVACRQPAADSATASFQERARARCSC